MRRTQRLIAAAMLIAFSSVLAGCSSGLGSFDPTDLLDFLDTKKKLPGDRKPVFPDGVPGLEQGVPKDLYKNQVEQQQQQDQQAAAAAAAPPQQPPPDEPKSKQAKKKGKKPADAANAAQDPAAAPNADASPEEGATADVPPAPKKKIVRKRTTAPPPDDQTAQPGQSAQQSQAPFPAPVPSGTFAR
jgi:hypothetical protein